MEPDFDIAICHKKFIHRQKERLVVRDLPLFFSDFPMKEKVDERRGNQ